MDGSAPCPALFVGSRHLLQREGGGVQYCNREYSAVLAEAGFRLIPIGWEAERSLIRAALSRLNPRVSPIDEPTGLAEAIVAAVQHEGARAIFYTLHYLPRVAGAVRRMLPAVPQVLLSHGVEAFDFYLAHRLRRPGRYRLYPRPIIERMLGRELFGAGEGRGPLDAVLTVSQFEADIERWLGSDRVMYVPRVIITEPLQCRPVDGRVGCVTTLEHPPNLDGVIRLLDAVKDMGPAQLQLRLISHQVEIGQRLARQYSFVRYLGPLTDDELRREAQSWCCYVNPLFVQAKGYSTKIGVGVGWQLPIATTSCGIRGYVWDTRVLPVADTPRSLAHMLLERSSIKRFEEFRSQTLRIAAATPAVAEVGGRVRIFLAGCDRPAAAIV
jgi:hypothetical protein